MRRAAVFRVPMAAPDDMSGLTALLDSATLQAQDIVAILAKTEGNGCVNDYVRGFAATMFALILAERLWSDADSRGDVLRVGGACGPARKDVLRVGGACGPPPPVAAPLVPRCALLPAATPRLIA